MFHIYRYVCNILKLMALDGWHSGSELPTIWVTWVGGIQKSKTLCWGNKQWRFNFVGLRTHVDFFILTVHLLYGKSQRYKECHLKEKERKYEKTIYKTYKNCGSVYDSGCMSSSLLLLRLFFMIQLEVFELFDTFLHTFL